MSDSTLEELVEAAKAPGTFSIINVLKERAYPAEEVEVFIDEDVAFLAAQVEEEITFANTRLDANAADAELLETIMSERDALIAKRDEMVKSMGGNKYIFSISGISEGLREDLYKKSVEKFPVEIIKKSNSFTGQDESSETENPERNRLFTNMLWSSHIKKITAPDGATQDGVTFDDALELRRSLPIASSSKITESIEKLRTATAVFMMTVDEDFLAKS